MTLFAVEGLVARYGAIEALHGVDLSVAAGEAVAVIGPNGAGKSTLLATAAGLHPVAGGRLWWEGREVSRWPAERRVRAGMALVPEGRRVFAGLSVRDNLILGGYGRRRHRATVRSTLDEVFDLFGRLADRRGQLAGTLSGGEQQMLAIGRALMGGPRLLLLDEPSLGLAPLAVREVVEALVALVARGVPLVLVEQNAAAAFTVAGRGYLLERGAVTAAGPVAELRGDPRVQAAYLGQREDW
ncbi:MAG: ABC transporter ATP-binding protein [Mycobacteriales bacterium]